MSGCSKKIASGFETLSIVSIVEEWWGAACVCLEWSGVEGSLIHIGQGAGLFRRVSVERH